MKRRYRSILSFVLVLIGHGPAYAAWVPSWTAAQDRMSADAALPSEGLRDATLRQSVRLSSGGRRIRILLSNLRGAQPLRIEGVHVALSGEYGTARIDPRSDRAVAFHGRARALVPPGAIIASDPINLPVPPLACIAISMHIVEPPVGQSGHLRSLSTSWIGRGDQLAAPMLIGASPVDHWYQLAAVQVDAPAPRLIVAFGDSITDGSRSPPNANLRWPDRLTERLQAEPSTRRWAVANAGMAGNQLLADDYGQSALKRFDRDVLAQPHAHTVILLDGVNDLGHFAKTVPAGAARPIFVARMIGAYRQLIARAHARKLRIIGVTLLPYGGSDYAPSPDDEKDRQAINRWIRTSGRFDAILDWDVLMRDPGDPSRLNPALDSGDHIHPSPAGYRAMANSIPIATVTR